MIRSELVDAEREGEAFTSTSQGFRSSSISRSYPMREGVTEVRSDYRVMFHTVGAIHPRGTHQPTPGQAHKCTHTHTHTNTHIHK